MNKRPFSCQKMIIWLSLVAYAGKWWNLLVWNNLFHFFIFSFRVLWAKSEMWETHTRPEGDDERMCLFSSAQRLLLRRKNDPHMNFPNTKWVHVINSSFTFRLRALTGQLWRKSKYYVKFYQLLHPVCSVCACYEIKTIQMETNAIFRFILLAHFFLLWRWSQRFTQ